jgi:hypothetical protein
MMLMSLHSLQQLTVTAPVLRFLSVSFCFNPSSNQPVASISAPQLVTLQWRDIYHTTYTQLKMENLQLLGANHFFVYGQELHKMYNSNCVGLLRRFELIENVVLTLLYHMVSSLSCVLAKYFHFRWKISDRLNPDDYFFKSMLSNNTVATPMVGSLSIGQPSI